MNDTNGHMATEDLEDLTRELERCSQVTQQRSQEQLRQSQENERQSQASAKASAQIRQQTLMIHDLSDSIKRKNLEIERIAQEKNAIQVAQNRADNLVNEKIAEISKLNERIRQIESQKTQGDTAVQEFKRAKQDWDATNHQQVGEISQLKGQLSQLTSQKTIADSSVQRLTEENKRLIAERENLSGQLSTHTLETTRLKAFEQLVTHTATRLRSAFYNTDILSFREVLNSNEGDENVLRWIGEHFDNVLTEVSTFQRLLNETKNELAIAQKQAARLVRFEQQWNALDIEDRLAFFRAIVPKNHAYFRPLDRGASILNTFVKTSRNAQYLVEDASGFQASRADLNCECVQGDWLLQEMAWEVLEEARAWVDTQIIEAGIRIIQPAPGAPLQLSEHQVAETGGHSANAVIKRCIKAGYAYSNKVRVKAIVELNAQSLPVSANTSASPSLTEKQELPPEPSGTTLQAIQGTADEEGISESVEASVNTSTADIQQQNDVEQTAEADDERGDVEEEVSTGTDVLEESVQSLPREKPDWYTPLSEVSRQLSDPVAERMMMAMESLVNLLQEDDLDYMAVATHLETITLVLTPLAPVSKLPDEVWMHCFRNESGSIRNWLLDAGIEVIQPKRGDTFDSETMQVASLEQSGLLHKMTGKPIERLVCVGFIRLSGEVKTVIRKAEVILK